LESMTIKKAILFLTLAISILGISGCRTTKSGTESIIKMDNQSPLITNVQSGKIIKDQYVASSSLTISDKSTFRITIIDRNLDVKKLYIRCFYPRDSEQPYLELGPFDLPAQEKKRTSLYLNEPVEISGPAGDWLIEVQVEDEKNNLSNIYRLHVIINQW